MAVVLVAADEEAGLGGLAIPPSGAFEVGVFAALLLIPVAAAPE